MTTKWYTLSMRVGVNEAIPKLQPEAIGEPGFTMAPAILKALGLEGPLWLDGIYLIPEDETRGS